MLKHSVVICGTCRDIESRLPNSIKIAENIGSMFEDYAVIVFENNSNDNTFTVLKEWENQNPKVKVLSSDLLEVGKFINFNEDKSPYRPEIIAMGRNQILRFMRIEEKYKKFDIVIWLDMDFKIEPKYEGFTKIIESKFEWDAQFAYGVDPSNQYWDWFAHRCDLHLLGPEIKGHKEFYVKKENLIIDDIYPVFSAFGGCGVYKRSSIENSWYSAVVASSLGQHYKSVLSLHMSEDAKRYRNKKYKHTTSVTIENKKDITNLSTGIYCEEAPEVVWRMNSFVYKYPAVCEHVTFHASMIKNRKSKLFINPELKFTYGG